MDTNTSTQLWQRSAKEIAAAVRTREVSSREVVDAHLDRIEQLNPTLNAFHVVLADEARSAADAADRALSGGEPTGPLHGVPVSVKENVDVAGTATTWGLAAMAEAIAPVDAPVVEHLRAAGAIVLARSNMPDFALRWHTDNDLCGSTKNPWDPTRTPGGSSAGEAVALATGMTPLGVGNDLGGSLRWPSQCNGTVALRPTQGRIPDASVVPPTDSLLSIQLFNSQGPMARRVEDLRLAFAVMCQPSPRDPWHVPAPPIGPALGVRPRVVVAVPADTEPAVADGVRRAASALESSGYDVEEAMPPGLDDAARLWSELLVDDVRRLWPFMEPVMSEGSRRFMTYAMEASPVLDVEGYAWRWLERQALLRSWSIYQAERPLVLAPVCLRMPFEPGADIVDAESAMAIVESMRTVVAVNLLGLPAVSVPAGTADDGLPLGVQVIGPRFREDLCLDAGAAIESVLGVLTPREV
jgi:amidase